MFLLSLARFFGNQRVTYAVVATGCAAVAYGAFGLMAEFIGRRRRADAADADDVLQQQHDGNGNGRMRPTYGNRRVSSPYFPRGAAPTAVAYGVSLLASVSGTRLEPLARVSAFAMSGLLVRSLRDILSQRHGRDSRGYHVLNVCSFVLFIEAGTIVFVCLLNAPMDANLRAAATATSAVWHNDETRMPNTSKDHWPSSASTSASTW